MPDIETIIKHRPNQEASLIKEVYEFANYAHKNQLRASGEPYISHPIAVAGFLDELNLDSKTISAALLHDVLEDTEVKKDELEKRFGKEITFLVDGVTKLKKIEHFEGINPNWETLRKMLFAMTEDIRVMLIKIADRWHNLSTIKFMPEEKRRYKALESIEIYAPLAERLGMGEIKGKIEDMAFPYAYPEEYKKLIKSIKSSYGTRIKFLTNLKPKLLKNLAEHNIRPLEVNARAKHYYSLWRKLNKYEGDINRIYDLAAIRIIVSDVSQCYKALGAIHEFWRPLPGKIKDYISTPKPNGYQSLHTTVFTDKGQIVEIQIKTLNMHHHAELGIAAHWAYSEAGKPKAITVSLNELSWVNKLREWKNIFQKPEDFLNSIKLDLFKDRIFVFTPKGDVKELPEGATPLDFAYKIHSDIGNTCTGAKINGRIVPLSFKLRNGQIVEILKSKNAKPSLDWLNFTRTTEAQKSIRAWFRGLDLDTHIQQGEKNLNIQSQTFFNQPFEKTIKTKRVDIQRLFNSENIDDLYVKVGRGDITAWQVIKKITDINKPKAKKTDKTRTSKKLKIFNNQNLASYDGLLAKIAKCCKPEENEPIVAYLTLGKGMSIHNKNCKNVMYLKKQRMRQLTWASISSKKEGQEISVMILAKDRIGLLKDIGEVASGLDINIETLKTKQASQGLAKIDIKFNIQDFDQLNSFFTSLRSVIGVTEITRQ